MKKSLAFGLGLLLWAVLLVPTVTAHAPIGSGDNESLEQATVIPDPTKSWAVYATLHEGGEAQYYAFEIARGERIQVTLFTTTAEEDATFAPGLVLMGLGIPDEGFVPDYVETPPGAGALARNGTRAAQATYEAFAPSAYVELADLALEAPESGTYYLAVHEPVRGGHYGLAIGYRESFTLAEWLLTPFALLSVYEWERQSLALVLAPAAGTFAIGLALLVRRHRSGRRLDPGGWIAASAGLLFLGTGATVGSQMVLSLSRSVLDGFAIVTLVFVALPILLGLLTLRTVLRHAGRWTVRSRVYLLLLAAGALTVWAGFVVGPILAVAAAGVPSRAARSARREAEADAG